MLLGIFISEYRKYAAWLLGAVNVLYTIPSIALLGFFITITGVGNLTALIVLILYALLPIIRSTYTGITHINPLIIEAAEAMGSTRWQLLWKIKLPLSPPRANVGHSQYGYYDHCARWYRIVCWGGWLGGCYLSRDHYQ